MKKIITMKRGRLAEELACAYISKLGYAIREKNWRFRRAEIDIIAADQKWLVFLEVKSRSSIQYGAPETAITLKKESLISDAASAYMLENGYNGEFRFDIISVLFQLDERPAIQHFKDAFFPGI